MVMMMGAIGTIPMSAHVAITTQTISRQLNSVVLVVEEMHCTLEDLVEQKYCALNKTMEKEITKENHATITLMKQSAAGTM